MPFVNQDGNFITVEQYQQIEKYCYDRFIDLVPNQNGFGHMTEWLKLDEINIWQMLKDCLTCGEVIEYLQL